MTEAEQKQEAEAAMAGDNSMSEITPENIYGDPSHADVLWAVRHDDEIWVEGAENIWIANCGSALDANRIVILHNFALEAKLAELADPNGIWST